MLAAVVCLLAIAVWRYYSIPAPIARYDGRTNDLTLETSGFSKDAPYGKQVAVRLDGVEGLLYYSGEREYQPGTLLTAPFRITQERRPNSHFKASTYFEITESAVKPRLRDRPVFWAAGLRGRIDSLYTGDNAAMMTGILLGDRSGFSDTLTENLFSSGMTHVAAVSGLHVSILAGFISLIARSRRRASFISLPLIFLFVAITGFTPSASRAGIMIAIFTLAPLLGREYNPLRALIAAFLILAAVNPYAVFEPAMQLSFSATLGLTLFAARWQRGIHSFLRRLPVPARAVRFASSSLSASFAALVFSIPFAAYWFGGVSLLAPLSNLLLLWLVNIIFILGAISLALPFIAPAAAAAVFLFRAALVPLSSVPYSVLFTAQPYLLAWLLYAYVMFVIMILSKRWKTPALLSAVMLIVCLTMTVWHDTRFGIEITVLDVGQGQSVVIRSGGETLVYDCGGGVSSGRIASRYLRSRGVRGIDYLVLSHYHHDHINGVPALLETMDVKRIIGPDLELPHDGYQIEIAVSSSSFMLGNTEIYLIPSLWFGDDNDRSLSLYAVQDGFSFLVTGDLGHSSERWLLRYTGLTSADVIIAGHHGSAGSTSEELLNALNPQAAVISSGITNSFGHPSPEVLRRLFDCDIAVYRTDRRGNVTIRR
jgi:competence protein ComEC